MTVVNGQIRIEAGELGPAVEKLLDLLMEKQQPIFIARNGRPVAEVFPTGELPAPDPRLQVRLNANPSELTSPDDWREAGL
jgi:hypothetical protein